MPPQSFTALATGQRRALFEQLKLSPFRADQIATWIYQKGVLAYGQMTDLPEELRTRLAESLPALSLSHAGAQAARQTTTEKVLFRCQDGALVESVAMRDGERLTFCLSSQVGCAMGCTFCASGLDGLERNLTQGEIIDQFLLLREATGQPTNVVFMGMGEPLANVDSVLAALDLLNDAEGLAIGARRITVSTVGLIAGIKKLAETGKQFKLAISLHAPTDELREKLLPSSAGTIIADIVAASALYAERTGRAPTWEYVLLSGVNDQPSHAQALARLLRHSPGKINLIPYNPVQGLPFKRPGGEVIRRFQDILTEQGANVTTRFQRGADIEAACGQLRRNYKD